MKPKVGAYLIIGKKSEYYSTWGGRHKILRVYSGNRPCVKIKHPRNGEGAFYLNEYGITVEPATKLDQVLA